MRPAREDQNQRSAPSRSLPPRLTLATSPWGDDPPSVVVLFLAGAAAAVDVADESAFTMLVSLARRSDFSVAALCPASTTGATFAALFAIIRRAAARESENRK